MFKKVIVLLLASFPFIVKAQQSREDFERALHVMEQQGQIRLDGTKIIVLHMNPGDTTFYRGLLNNMLAKVDQSKNPYSISFEIDPKYAKNAKTTPLKIKTLSKKDTVQAMVYTPAPVQYNHNFRENAYLENGDFELGYFRQLPGWKITGQAFGQKAGADIYTWNDFDVVSKADVGGDYWEDIRFYLGNRHLHWMSSKGDGVMGSSYEVGRATGMLTSEPFKIYPNQNFLSFLISGGNDAANLKVELLEYVISTRLAGSNVRGVLTGQRTLPGVSQGSITNVWDTLYKPIAGIGAKTGHNNPIFRRDWWDVHNLDTSKLYAIRITDNSTNLKWGIINVDDFRMVRFNPADNREADDSLRIQQITIKDMIANTDQQIMTDVYVPVYGAADLHTHLMSHLSMGKKLIYGAPDSGSIVSAGTHVRGFDAFAPECNPSDERAHGPEDALGNCNAAHGGWGADNDCGNYIRAAVLNFAFDAEFENRVPLERNLHGDHPHDGYPNFLYWPHFSSASHQQMWVDWIRRAYQGGLRVMVTLTVNSELLGAVLSGDGPMDDKASADLQIEEIKSFIDRHRDFMELARTPEDMRRIIRSNKLAVILGMEVDNIGNFNYANVTVNETTAKTEVRRLYDKGVRYIFPVHLVNNKFGGSAIYSLLFNFSNRYTNSQPLRLGDPIRPGLMFNVERAADPRIKYTLSLTDGVATAGAMNAAIAGINGLWDGISQIPFPPALNLDFTSPDFCPDPKLGCISQFKIIKSLLTPDAAWDTYNNISGGQQNQLGLTDLGKVAIKEMMRLGMVIDIDHMSDHSVSDMLMLANEFDYPVASGHNGMRDGFFEDREHKVSENQRTNEQLQNIRSLGGVFGIGIGECTAGQYLTNFRIAMNASKMNGGAIMMGSDINGAVTMPKPRHGPTRIGMRERYIGGGGNSIYNYWSREVEYAGTGMPLQSSPGSPMKLRKYKFGNKEWNYNTEGVAHMGLYPDYFQDLKNLGMNRDERQVFFSAADYFVAMWDKAVKSGRRVR
jgi:microsomal dipeptidase-like Zn-dependent dipeptidase